jgi:ABC-2 type transport system permease protein
MTTLVSLDHAGSRYGRRQAMRAELSKLRTLRSTTWTLLATVIGSLAISVLASNNTGAHGKVVPGFDPTNQSLSGLTLGSLTIGILGILAITGEYSSGTIRSTLAATPRRPLFIAAKAAVVGLMALVVGEMLTFACFFLGQGIMAGHAPTASLGQSGVLTALVLSGAFLSLLGLIGLALGVIIRHTAGAIGAFVGIIFLLTALLQPLRQHGNPGRYAPEEIFSNSVAAVVHQPGQLGTWAGFLLMVGYCVVAFAVAFACVIRRDA